MKFAQYVHSHHRSILFLLVVLAVGGLASSLKLPVALFGSLPVIVTKPAELLLTGA
jgi:hypothetical protein